MAYRADIEIAVRGAQELKRLGDQINATSKLVDGLNNYLENIGTGGVVRNINNLQQVVSNAAAALNEAALGTKEATLAAQNYVAATSNLNSGLREKLQLLKQVNEAERQQRLSSAGIRETTQFGEPIGPGQASPVALSSQLRGRTEQILAERKGAAELTAVLQDLNEQQRQLENSKLDAKAARIQQELDQQAAAAAETAAQIDKLNERQVEFTTRTDAAAAAARRQTAEFYRQQRLLRQAQTGFAASTVEQGPGGPGFSGGFTSAQRQQANEQAILRAKQEQNKVRRQNVDLASREELFELRLGRILERNAATETQRAKTREATSNAIIGGAFPLLFGQGLGASVGGGIGGFAGGMAGGQLGFGLSLVGTAVGASLDQTIQSARDFAKSLREGGDAASYLEQRIGYLNPVIKTQLQNLQASGQTAKAAELAFSELAKTMGTEGASAFLEIGKQSEQANRSLSLLIDRFIGAGYASNKFFQEAKFGPGGSVIDLLPQQFKPAPNAATPAETAAATQRTAELTRSNELLRVQLALTTVSAKTDLDRYVTLQRQTAQKEYENELTKISIQLKNKEINLAQNEQLIRGANLKLSVQLGEIERSRVEEIRRRTEEAQRARKQADDKRIQEEIKALTLESQILNLFDQQTQAYIEQQTLAKGEEAGLSVQLSMQDKLNESRLRALNIDKSAALLAADTAEEIVLINLREKSRLDLLQRQNDIEEMRARRRKNEIFFERFGVTDTLMQAGKRAGESAFGNAVGAAGGAGQFRTDINLMPGLTNGVIGEQFALLKTELEELVKVENQVIQAAKSIGDAFGTSLKGVISGTMTAQEALANFFQSVADHFADMAAQMISKWIQMQILGLAQSLLPGGSTIFPRGVDNFSSFFGAGGPSFSVGAFGGARAAGGPVASGSTYMVGERGPELFVPRSSGTIVPNHALSGTTNVVVNVDASGSTVQGDSPNANQLGRVISAAVQAELVKQQRPGGLLASTR